MSEEALVSVHLLRRSIDAREGVKLVCSCAVEVKNESGVLRRCKNKNVQPYAPKKYTPPAPVSAPEVSPVVIGAGPAGLFCALLLAGCGTAAQTPDATPTPAQEAAATPTPTPDPLSTLPYTDGQLYAAAYLGYQAPTDLDFFQQTYFGGRELPVHHISDGDFYLIIPRDPNATVRLYKNDMVTDSKTLFYEQTNGDAFVIGCNVSDIFPDVTVSITSGGETVDFSPYISLKDGSVQVGECGLNITRISTSS